MLGNVSQVSDVPHGPLVSSLQYLRKTSRERRQNNKVNITSLYTIRLHYILTVLLSLKLYLNVFTGHVLIKLDGVTLGLHANLKKLHSLIQYPSLLVRHPVPTLAPMNFWYHTTTIDLTPFLFSSLSIDFF